MIYCNYYTWRHAARIEKGLYLKRAELSFTARGSEPDAEL
jgi:hypothetical protein